MHFVDTHTHLTEEALESRLETVLSNAVSRGVSRFIIPTYDCDSWKRAQKICEENSGIVWAVGVHPLCPNISDCKEIPSKITDKKCIAIGETGLDYVNPATDKKLQQDIFIQQLIYAREFSVPVILHCRKAHEDLLEILHDFTDVRSVLHSCSFSAEQIKPFLQLKSNMYVGFSGVITRTRAKKAKKLAAALPLNRIVLETDSPFIGTANHPPPTSEPADTADVAAAIAEARNESIATIAEATTENAENLFSLPTAGYHE